MPRDQVSGHIDGLLLGERLHLEGGSPTALIRHQRHP
jgi:hypothetical protein